MNDAQLEYYRKYRAKNKAKIKEIQKRYWDKKNAELLKQENEKVVDADGEQ